MKKLAIVVGHNIRSQGAVRKDNGETEFVYNSRLAEIIKQKASDYGLNVEIFKRTPGRGEIARVYQQVDFWNADASIELHFNSFGNPSASGTETLSSGSSRSLKLAEEVQMEMVETLGLTDRGILVRNRRTKGKGYLSLVSGKAPAILIEPFFGSNARGLAASDELFEQQKLAEAILEGAARAMGSF
jgi:N-acetylmuramoyl-L-alanine amidase